VLKVTPALSTVSLLFIVALVAMACAQASSNPNVSTAAGSSAGAPSGEVTLAFAAFTSEPFDPSLGPPILGDVGGPVFEPLYIHWPPSGEVRPFVAESGKMAEDGMNWTFTLRKDARFSNDKPVTADDVKFSLDRYRSDASRSSEANVFRQSIDSIDVLDPATFRVRLKKPWINLPTYLAGRTGNEGIVLPKGYVEEVGWSAFAQKPVGSGTYRVGEYKPSVSVTYEAVANHWRARPKFSKVHYIVVPEEQARVALLRSGAADLVEISANVKQQVEQAGHSVLAVPYGKSWRVKLFGRFPDLPDNPMKKLEVRKALNLAVDKKEILDQLFAGAGEVAPYGYSFPGFTQGAPRLPVPPYDPTEARRLLGQAGYPSGFSTAIYAVNVGCSIDQARRVAEAVGGYWEKIGVKAQVIPEDFTIFRPKFRTQSYAPELTGRGAIFCNAGSPLGTRDLSTNFWGQNAKLTNVADAEIEKAGAATSESEMLRLTDAAYRKIYDDYIEVALISGASLYGANQKLSDLPLTPTWANLGMWLTYDRP